MENAIAALLSASFGCYALANYSDQPTRSASAVRQFKHLSPCPETGGLSNRLFCRALQSAPGELF